MKLTTVLASVNNNPKYYKFIPKQILFWKYFNIRFITIFVGKQLPDELIEYSDNIIIWNKNLDLNTAYVGQNIRMYYASLLKLPDECSTMKFKNLKNQLELREDVEKFLHSLSNHSVSDCLQSRIPLDVGSLQLPSDGH